MQEVEVKILEINVEEITKKLESLGAKKTFDGIIASSYFDTPNKQLKIEKKMLRVRKNGTETILTLKISQENKDAKVSDEFEVEIEDNEQITTILKALGYVEYTTDQRKRISYTLKNAHIDIDVYEHIPPYLEIESDNVANVKNVVELLGFTMQQTNKWSGKKVLNYYKQQTT